MEKELRDIINQIEEKKKNLMWRDIYLYLEKNHLFGEQPLWSEFLKLFYLMNTIRNNAAHGETITLDDYNHVKKIVLDSELLEWISEYRFLNPVVNHVGVEG